MNHFPLSSLFYCRFLEVFGKSPFLPARLNFSNNLAEISIQAEDPGLWAGEGDPAQCKQSRPYKNKLKISLDK